MLQGVGQVVLEFHTSHGAALSVDSLIKLSGGGSKVGLGLFQLLDLLLDHRFEPF